MSPSDIIAQMMAKDDFSRWLKLEVTHIAAGHCIAKMKIREEMTNGFDVAHGGITFSFADSAFAFASNSRGQLAVSIETTISHTRPVFINDVLTAEATEDHVSSSLGRYTVKVKNQEDKIVALFKGTVFRKKESWN